MRETYKYYITIIKIFLIVLLGNAQDNKYLPVSDSSQIITEQNYIIDYSSVDKQAKWVVMN